uniref:Uncharacterized protein n=1 Tax=uncultured prokaryote TaxID=198431 RepID=A0A0H5Q7P3_9ZZZZ|nr:hypothetical protein [uncultured prokaryote]
MMRVNAQWTGEQGAPYFTTVHFGGEETNGNAQDAASRFAVFLNTIKAMYTNKLTVQVNPTVLFVNPETGMAFDAASTSTGPATGTGSDGLLPPANQGMVRLGTSDYSGGRAVRGRLFIPGPTKGYDTDGKPYPAYRSALKTAAETMIAGAAADGAPFVIWSSPRKATTKLPARDGFISNVTTADTWTQWAILRSRRD